MLKKGIFILFSSLFCTLLSSQQISHQVVVPAAVVASTGNYCISQTIGESMVRLAHCESFDLTQGFQQPSLKAFKPEPPMGNGVKIYPNPVKTTLTLELFGDLSTEYRLVIFGLNGSIYFENNYTCIGRYWHKIPLNVSAFSRGTYFIKVIAKDGAISRLFKIEKL